MGFVWGFQILKNSSEDFLLLLNRITETVAKGDEFKDLTLIANICQGPKDIKAK